MNELTINPALVIGASMIIALLTGVAVSALQIGASRNAGRLLACIGALWGGFVGGALALALPNSALSATCIFVGAICGAIPLWIAQNKEARRARVLLTQAHNLQAFLVKNFNRLDANADGLIVRADLESALLRAVEFNDRYFIRHCLANFKDVGHPESAHEDTRIIDYPGGHGPISIPYTVWSYAISVEDTSTYPDRIRTKYACWFPRSAHPSR